MFKNKDLLDYVVFSNDKLETILERLNKLKTKIVFCVNGNGNFIGSITDGDIRRALLTNDFNKLKAEIICNKASVTADINKIYDVKTVKEKKITTVPVVNKSKLIDILFLEPIMPNLLPPVVLMAGGLGTRLGSITKNKPKPLVNLTKDSSIIDLILNNLISQGVKEVFITLNYKADQIIDHVSKNYLNKIKTNFVTEKKRLGTAGSLYYLKEKMPQNFFLMNADILTNLDFHHLHEFHSKNNFIISVVANRTSYQLSKGIIEHDGHEVTAVKEKPNYNYTYNAGIYMLNKNCLKSLKEEYLDMPDLINKHVKSKKVGIFPLFEYWRDLGIVDDLMKAKEDIKNDLKK